MFYSYDILQRRSGRFGTIWLAATRSIALKRKDYLKVDVSKSCSEIIDYLTGKVSQFYIDGTPPKFSLYLSAQLTYGIVRVIVKQYDYFFDELTDLHNHCRFFRTLWKAPVDSSIDMPVIRHADVDLPPLFDYLNQQKLNVALFQEDIAIGKIPQSPLRDLLGFSPPVTKLWSPQLSCEQLNVANVKDITLTEEDLSLVSKSMSNITAMADFYLQSDSFLAQPMIPDFQSETQKQVVETHEIVAGPRKNKSSSSKPMLLPFDRSSTDSRLMDSLFTIKEQTMFEELALPDVQNVNISNQDVSMFHPENRTTTFTKASSTSPFTTLMKNTSPKALKRRSREYESLVDHISRSKPLKRTRLLTDDVLKLSREDIQRNFETSYQLCKKFFPIAIRKRPNCHYLLKDCGRKLKSTRLTEMWENTTKRKIKFKEPTPISYVVNVAEESILRDVSVEHPRHVDTSAVRDADISHDRNRIPNDSTFSGDRSLKDIFDSRPIDISTIPAIPEVQDLNFPLAIPIDISTIEVNEPTDLLRSLQEFAVLQGNALKFSDLCPLKTTGRRKVALIFANLLQCIQDGHVKIEQKDHYSDIVIEVL